MGYSLHSLFRLFPWFCQWDLKRRLLPSGGWPVLLLQIAFSDSPHAHGWRARRAATTAATRTAPWEYCKLWTVDAVWLPLPSRRCHSLPCWSDPRAQLPPTANLNLPLSLHAPRLRVGFHSQKHVSYQPPNHLHPRRLYSIEARFIAALEH